MEPVFQAIIIVVIAAAAAATVYKTVPGMSLLLSIAAALLALFYPVFRSEQAMAKGMPWLLSAAVLLAVAFTFYMGGLRVTRHRLTGRTSRTRRRTPISCWAR